jgi:hypothetical protein
LIESSGLLVCEGCGLVAAPVYETPRVEPDSAYAPAAANPARGFYERALEAVAAELGLPAKAALELYRRLKALAKPEEAAAVALFVTAKRCGARYCSSSAFITAPSILALPPVGLARTRPQMRHVTVSAAWLNTTCSLPQSGQRTRRNRLRGFGTSTLLKRGMRYTLSTISNFFILPRHLCRV